MLRRLGRYLGRLPRSHNGAESQPSQYPIRPWLLPFNFRPYNRSPWHAYWRERGQEWRIEPEISQERQVMLAAHLAVPAHDYPFGDMELTRADVEWLLATHHGGRGPVKWDDKQDFRREGLDLRGAILRDVDLSRLPLTRLFARNAHLERANLQWAHLEG